MAAEKQQSSASAEVATTEGSLLESAIAATKQTERSRAEELLRNFTEQALQGAVVFNKDVSRSIRATIEKFDEQISKQLAAVMHHPEFQKLEGTWRGLSYLVMNSETGLSSKFE